MVSNLVSNTAFIFSGFFGLTAIILGAYGSHGLKDISPHDLNSWQTAVNYQLFHSLLIFGLAILISNFKINLISTKLSLIFAILGVLLFSGTIFIKILFQNKFIFISSASKITPYGGLCFMIAWVCLIILGFRKF